ncbi:MAG: PDZ domain-containing protein [Pseudomonadota bacterium]
MSFFNHIAKFGHIPIVVLLLGISIEVAAEKQQRHRLSLGLYSSKYTMVVGINDPIVIPEIPSLTVAQWDKRKNRKKYWYEPNLRRTTNMDDSVAEMQDSGFIMVGYSAFKSSEMPTPLSEQPHFTSMSANDQWGVQNVQRRFGRWHQKNHPGGLPKDMARYLGAHTVILQEEWTGVEQKQIAARVLANDSKSTTTNQGSSYTDTFTDATTLSQSNSRNSNDVRTSSTNASVTLSDTHSSNNYWDQQTNKSKSFTTQLMTESEDKFDILATFWMKADLSKVAFGAITKTLPPRLRRTIGSRHARLVSQVIGNSPAWEADIWEGDVITSINGQRVKPKFGEQVRSYMGQEVEIGVWRDGENLVMPARINVVQ